MITKRGSIDNAVTLNRYAYANANPVTNIDPFGLSAERGIQKINQYNYIQKVSNQANRRPNTGEPGSTYKSPNGDTRTYGPDGTPAIDYDHSDHGYPNKHPHDENGGHYHDWNNGQRGPAYFEESFVATVVVIFVIFACVTICVA